jgi:hypothetical protein
MNGLKIAVFKIPVLSENYGTISPVVLLGSVSGQFCAFDCARVPTAGSEISRNNKFDLFILMSLRTCGTRPARLAADSLICVHISKVLRRITVKHVTATRLPRELELIIRERH